MSEQLPSKEEVEFERWFAANALASFRKAYGPNEPFRDSWGSGFKRRMRDAWMARAAHETCERQPFAGLRSISFDVSELPRVALVMWFDNIETAQAARDQLWQPSGATQKASEGPYCTKCGRGYGLHHDMCPAQPL